MYACAVGVFFLGIAAVRARCFSYEFPFIRDPWHLFQKRRENIMAVRNEQIAKDVLAAVGGKSNSTLR